MTSYPVLPAIWIVILTAVLVLIRVVALYRLLLRAGAGRIGHLLLRWSGTTLAVILLVIAACRPGFDNGPPGPSSDPAASSNVNVFFVVDRSVNTRVEDFGDGKSRMSGMRADLATLINSYPQARFALISFAGNAALDWPLSDDAASLHSVVNGLSPYTQVPPDAVYRANAVAARDVLRAKIEQAARTFSGSQSLVFYLGVGAPDSRVAATSFELGRNKIAGGAVLGYGTTAGGPIPQGWVDGTKRYQTDPDGTGPLNSTIDEVRLQSIASQLGVPYVHRDSGPLPNGVAPAATGVGDADASAHLIGRLELYWVCTLIAAALLLAEGFLTLREYRRHRMSTRDVGR
ncbi:VWA domain-containing protein [Mycobacterium asiaticum]|uniref:Uncharacterized protein n=1 Tax=Mycobacterium asiaticum TaxID=1790 RepID=A0A1A3N3Q7_MYCAS|nr:VWA domain-containing protein [Mycobacterium asiaticum]OBK15689.1 hypothetical protein A5636_04895 [Mycobacterium asiaticum]